MQKYGLGTGSSCPCRAMSRTFTKEDFWQRKKIESDLPYDQFGTMGFLDMFMRQICTRKRHRQ